MTVKPGANATSTATDVKQLPCASQTPYQSTRQIHSCQVSPIAELNSFVAAALPNGDEKCPFKNETYSTSQPVSLLSVFTKPAYTVFRASRGVSKLTGKKYGLSSRSSYIRPIKVKVLQKAQRDECIFLYFDQEWL